MYRVKPWLLLSPEYQIQRHFWNVHVQPGFVMVLAAFARFYHHFGQRF
jgi:hypothetical protein